MKGKKKCLKMIIFISLFLIIIFALLFIFNNNNFNSVENNNITMENEKPKEIEKFDSIIIVDDEINDTETLKEDKEVIKNEDHKIEVKESSTNKEEEKQNTSIQENISSNNNKEETKKDNNNETSNNTIVDNNVVEKEDNSSEETNTDVVENKQEEIKEETNNDTEVIDEEYERLMSLVEYETYEECMADGFAIHEQDTVNIYGFSCPYIAYKGRAIGYRLKLEYSNPMEQ